MTVPYNQYILIVLNSQPFSALPDADYAVWYYARVADPYLVIQRGNIVIRVRYAPFSGAPEIEPEELARLILSHLR